MISGDSDFFLLGGNSLLLGKLFYHIRKKTNVTVAVATLFTNSTVNGIASLIALNRRNISLDSLDDCCYLNTASSSQETMANFYRNYTQRKGREQTHPLNLIV